MAMPTPGTVPTLRLTASCSDGSLAPQLGAIGGGGQAIKLRGP